MKRKVKRPFDNEQFRKGYVAGIFAAEKELNTELLHFAEKAHKIMSEGTFPDYGVKINFKDSNNIITTNLDMKTEEKAKKYDEALEWMREVYPTLTGAAKEDAEHYFPELKESKESEDERIRKEIIDFIQWAEDRGMTRHDYHQAKRPAVWIAYLEKQKEQKPEHFELKAGKWYICHRAFCCRADRLTVKEGERFMCEKDGVVKGFVIKEPEKYFKECSAPAPMEDEQKEQKPITINQDEKEFLADEITAFLCNYDKEFDGEDPVPSEVAEHFYLLGKQAQEQKSVEWSEEDKETIDLTIAVLKENLPNGYFKTNPANTLNMGAISTDQLINRLKSLRPQPKPEWDEEDEKMLNLAIEWAEIMSSQFSFVDMDPRDFRKIIAWLKSLKDRGNFLKSNTNSPSEWSEDDEKLRKNIIWLLEIHPSYRNEVDWLKSLRPVSKESLQPHWKPSEQEKGALRTAIYILTEERNFPKAAAQLQNILDAFEGKESRKDWKPSEDEKSKTVKQ